MVGCYVYRHPHGPLNRPLIEPYSCCLFTLSLRDLMLDLRDAFVLPDPPHIELRAFTHGLMPKPVPALMQAFTDDWAERGVDAWNRVPNHWRPDSGETVGWWSLPEYLAEHFVAPLLQAPPHTCILQPNVHTTMQYLLSAPEVFASGRHVVITEAAFPSVQHSVKQWQDVFDLSLTVVPLTDAGFIDPTAMEQAIRPDTALAVVSHVGFTTGELLPPDVLRGIADTVHAHGGLFVIDGYHSVGSVPVDVQALGADLYMGGLLKEACGSSGNAFVYLRDGLDLTPRMTGWFGDDDPFGFQPEPGVHPDVRRRFMGGTTAVASMYHAVEGMRILRKAGIAHVREHSLALTEQCIARADAAGMPLQSPRPAERRGAMVILEVDAADRLCAYLKQRDVYTDSRQQRYLRMAPFVWNTPAEIDRAFDIIAEAIASGAYHDTLPETATEAGPVT